MQNNLIEKYVYFLYVNFESKVKTQHLSYALGEHLPKPSKIMKLVLGTFFSIVLLNWGKVDVK